MARFCNRSTGAALLAGVLAYFVPASNVCTGAVCNPPAGGLTTLSAFTVRDNTGNAATATPNPLSNQVKLFICGDTAVIQMSAVVAPLANMVYVGWQIEEASGDGKALVPPPHAVPNHGRVVSAVPAVNESILTVGTPEVRQFYVKAFCDADKDGAKAAGEGYYYDTSGNPIEVQVLLVKVDIDAPTVFPAYTSVGHAVSLGSTVSPAASAGWSYKWTKVSGPVPGTVTFSPSDTSEDPVFSADVPGTYKVKVAFTKGGATCEKTSGDITVVEVEFVKTWSDQFPGVSNVQNYLPAGCGNLSHTPEYILMATRSNDRVYAKTKIVLTPDTPAVRSALHFNLAAALPLEIFSVYNDGALLGDVVSVGPADRHPASYLHVFCAGFDSDGSTHLDQAEVLWQSAHLFRIVDRANWNASFPSSVVGLSGLLFESELSS